MNNLFKSRPVKKVGTGVKKNQAVLPTGADKRPPRPTANCGAIEAVGDSGSAGKVDERSLTAMPTSISTSATLRETKGKGDAGAGDPKISGKKRKSPGPTLGASLVVETAAALKEVETLGAHTIPESSALGHGFGGDLPLPDLWKSFHNHYVALGKRLAWLDQCLALKKSELVRAQANADTKVRGLEAEVNQLKGQVAAVEKEREEWKAKASSSRGTVVKEYLASSEAKKARLEADEAAVEVFCQSADLQQLVDERIAAWREGVEGQAWLKALEEKFVKSSRMADFYIAGMTAARTMGITELAQATTCLTTSLTSLTPQLTIP